MSALLTDARGEKVGRTTRPQRAIRRNVPYLVLGIFCVTYLLPVVFAVITSFKPAAEARSKPLSLPSTLEFQNYADAIESMDYARALLNSTLITGTAAVLTVMLGSVAAYPLARLTRRWAKGVYFVFVTGLTIPVFVLITPLFLLMRDLGLLNTRLGVIIIYTALNLPLAVFFYTSFLRTVPTELEDAARVDGCGTMRTFWLIVFPLLRPTTATLSIFVSLSIWNDLVVPLVFLTGEENRTLVLAAFTLVGSFGFNPAELFPAVVLAMLPLAVLFALLQRQVVSGLVSGAVKG